MTSMSSLGIGNTSQLANMRQALFSKMDANSDGAISKDEFVSSRPKGVSADKASSLYSKIDSSGSNAVTADQLEQGLAANGPGASGGGMSSDMLSVLLQASQQTDSTSAKTSDSSDSKSADKILSDLANLLSDLSSLDSSDSVSSGKGPSAKDIFGKIDTNGDGKVTKEEFAAGRPKGMSEDQANSLFSSIDTKGTGSITEQQFADSMPKPGGGHLHTATTTSSDSASSASDTTASSSQLLLEILQAIQSYTSTAYSNNSNLGSSSLAVA